MKINPQQDNEKISPRLNRTAIISILIAYLSIFTFGVDTQAASLIVQHTDFLNLTCVKPGFGTEQTCGIDKQFCEDATVNKTNEFYPLCAGKTGKDAWAQCCNIIRQDNSEWKLVVNTIFILMLQIGGIVAGLTLAPSVTEKHGRLMSMRIGAFIVLIACLFQSYISFDSFWVMFVARFFLGYGAGFQVYAVPMYGSEVSNAKHRGLTIGLFQVCTVVAALLCGLIIYGTHDSLDWKFAQFLAALPTPIVFIGTFFMPPSPRYVMGKHGFDAGYEALSQLRSTDPIEEAQAMWKNIEVEKDIVPVTYKEAFTAPNLSTRVWCGIIINMLQQTSGVNVLINFAPSFWVQAGLSPSSQDLSSIVQQGSFLVFVIIGYLLLDSKYGGRRIQYLVGTAVMIFSAILSLIGASINNYMILFVSSLVIFGSGFQISHGLIAWSYPAELFNLRERKKVFHLFYSAQWFMQIVFTGLSTYLFGTTQKDLMILCGLFTATNIIALIFIWFYVEEVKGVPIEDVPALFEHTPRGHWPLAVKKSLNSFDKGSLDHQVVV